MIDPIYEKNIGILITVYLYLIFELSTICETIENCHNSTNLIFG